MQNSDKYDLRDNIPSDYFKNIVKCGKIKPKYLKKRIIQDFKNILAFIKNAKEKEFKSENILKASLCLYDNFYIINDSYRKCIFSLKHFCFLSSDSNKESVYFNAFYNHLKNQDLHITNKNISDFIKALESSPSLKPEYMDYYTLETLFMCAVICLISETCRNNSCTEDLMNKHIKSLKNIRSYPFDLSFENSGAEKLLKLDPAGFYPCMSKKSKDIYRTFIAEKSAKLKISEETFAKEILNKARNAKSEKYKHIGAYLYPENKSVTGRIYFILLFTIVFFVIFSFSVISPFSVLFVFPVYESVKIILDKIFSHFVKPLPLASLELEKIPDMCGILTIFTTILNGKKYDKELFTSLETMFVSNRDDNIYFGILADLSESKTQQDPKDEKIINYAISEISSLCEKYGKHFFLFIRKRVYSKNENVYMGYERKRGALMELTKLLCNEKTDEFLYTPHNMPKNVCEKIKYVLTLDADTNISYSSIKELAGIMLHPLNTPEICEKTGMVKSGYGILQPRVSPKLSAFLRTPFTNIFCENSGIDIYDFASFELYQTVFDKGIFCGKGIFDKYAFNAVINNKQFPFPEKVILSHDILEGERLRCGYVSSIEFTDGFPKNYISYLKRHHRWVRGDIQNLKFISDYYSANGKNITNHFSPLSKYKIFDNARRAFVPVFALSGLLLANFLSPMSAFIITLASVFYIIFPFISDLSEMITTFSFECATRRFFSHGVTSTLWQSFIKMLFSLSCLPSYAVTTLDAIIKSFYRLIFSKKKLLEWQTFSQTESEVENSLLFHIRFNIFGAVIGTFMFVFSPYGLLKITGFMWFLFPLISYASSLPIKNRKQKIKPTDKNTLSKYVKDMFSYFSDYAETTKTSLPCDNVGFYDSEKCAKKTSPTNIGLYLASIVCARDFDLINNFKMYNLVDKVLSGCEKLEKWNGHLYNWYDTESGNILTPKFVSSVDSGNFLASLIAVSEGIKEYAKNDPYLLDLIPRINKLIFDTDIEKIYDKNKNLFYIGVEVNNKGKEEYSENYYDMLISEARTLSYIAISLGKVNKKHYSVLSRPMIKHKDTIGVAAWSGTAFEYFMPSLFLPTPKGSLMYEALQFAYKRQQGRKTKTGLWGISESGYYDIDSDNNYKYYAFGVNELAIKKDAENNLVVSPYSTFLMLPMDKKACMSNLKNFIRHDQYGKYGFYEAADYSLCRKLENGKVVKSFMAHHIGMSIVACCNACFDDIFVKRFMNNVFIKSAHSLLEEKIPVNVIIKRKNYNINK